MKSAPRAESTTPPKPKQKRRNRPRPTPRWLKAQAEGPEALAQRRCLLVLSVLSGEQPVTDAIASTGVSRQLYYQLEEKALKGMLRALGPGAETNEDLAQSLADQLAQAQARVKQLETEKRRAERLLLLTRKLVRPGSIAQQSWRTTGATRRGQRPKCARTARQPQQMADPRGHHRDIHKRGYNDDFIKEIEKIKKQRRQPTADDMVRIRDKLVKKYGIENYRPSRNKKGPKKAASPKGLTQAESE